ncbi:MAG: FtsX-like permease family protein, partial [Dehalococcoidia bacterium]
ELAEGKIILNESAAEELAAEPGDTILLRVLGRLHEFQVSALAEDTLLSGQVDLAEPQGAVIHLDDAQAIFEQPQRVTGVGVTVRGGIEGALQFSDAVDQMLNTFLEQRAAAEVRQGLPPQERVYADAAGNVVFDSDPFKQDTVDNAEFFGSIFTTFFLVMGSFSVASGILLIFLIFVMLSEERKTEMGISRAVGMQRSQLVQSFLAEGLAYDLGAALIGTVAGILIAFGMVEVLEAALGDRFGFSFSQSVEPRSIVVAAGAGILLTFVTVIVSSFRVSQLNIVAAIRDLPDEGGRKQRRISFLGMLTTPVGLVLMIFTPLLALAGGILISLPFLGAAIRRRGLGEWTVLPAWRLMRWRQEWWFVFILVGVLAVIAGVDSESAFVYLFGLSTVPIGLVLLARRMDRAGRAAYSVMGALILLFWLAPQDWHKEVVGKELEGGPELLILSGVMMVTAATVLVIFNLDLLIAPLRASGRLFGRFAPAVRTAVAYPPTARYRTGMTVAMIAIITFALVIFTTINQNFSRAFTGDAATGGFDVQADSSLNDAIDDLTVALNEAGAAGTAAGLETVARLRVGSVNGTDVRTLATERWDPLDDEPILDASGAPIVDAVRGGDALFGNRLVFFAGADDAFLRENEIPLQARATGFGSDEAVWRALRDPANRYAVVSAVAVDAGGNPFGLDDDAFEMPSTVDESSRRIPRVRLQVSNAGRSTELQIIGVIDQIVGVTEPEFPFLPTLLTTEAIFQQLYEQADLTRHLGTVRAGVDALETARAIEAALRIETVSITDELEERQETSNAILSLFQGFIGLGLFAGLAALGVIAVRSVVERRQQIGVLRAIGFRGGMIRLQLMMEMSFIAGLGIAMGTTLAILLAWRLFSDGVFGSSGGLGFYVPVVRIGVIVVVAFVASLLMTYLPARQAGRVSVAEALRYE